MKKLIDGWFAMFGYVPERELIEVQGLLADTSAAGAAEVVAHTETKLEMIGVQRELVNTREVLADFVKDCAGSTHSLSRHMSKLHTRANELIS